MKKSVKVIITKPNGDCYVDEIPNRLNSFQDIIGGYIETLPTYINGEFVVLVFNEEGLLKDVEMNPFFESRGIVGPCIITKVRNGDFADLTNDQISNILKKLG